MKRVVITLITLFCSLTAAWSMSYEEARQQAWFLTDKMAYELNLTPEQYDQAYEINLDYLMSIRTASDCTGNYWFYRDADLQCILYDWQYNLYRSLDYFFRPIRWISGGWYFPVVTHYRYGYYYFDRPNIFLSYRGGRWHGRRSGGPSPYYGMRAPRGAGMRDRFQSYGRNDRPGRHGDGGWQGHQPGQNDGMARGGRRGDGHDNGAGRNGNNSRTAKGFGQSGGNAAVGGSNGDGGNNKSTLRPWGNNGTAVTRNAGGSVNRQADRMGTSFSNRGTTVNSERNGASRTNSVQGNGQSQRTGTQRPSRGVGAGSQTTTRSSRGTVQQRSGTVQQRSGNTQRQAGTRGATTNTRSFSGRR